MKTLSLCLTKLQGSSRSYRNIVLLMLSSHILMIIACAEDKLLDSPHAVQATPEQTNATT